MKAWDAITLMMIGICLPVLLRWVVGAIYVVFALFMISLPLEREGPLLRLQRRLYAEWRRSQL